MWQFQHNDGTFRTCDEPTTAALEAAYQKATQGSQSVATYRLWDTFSYSLDIATMRQTNLGTKKVRVLRRVAAAVVPPPPPLPKFECAICANECEGKLRAPVGSNCDPTVAHAVCNACVAQAIASEMSQKMFTERIPCPCCKKIFEYDEIRTRAEASTWQQFETLVFRRSLSKMDDFVYCAHNCGSGQLHNGGEDLPIMNCHSCRKATCTTHGVPWHTGETCDEYKARVAVTAEAATAATIAQTTKRCPSGKGCTVPIEKNEGCDHMTCAQCKFEFCWLCLARYDRIRQYGCHRHRETCQYYAAYTPRKPELGDTDE